MGPSALVVVASLVATVASCARGASGPAGPAADSTVKPWKADPDVAALGRLWHERSESCVSGDARAYQNLKGIGPECAIGGWDSVALLVRPDGRSLLLKGRDWDACALDRFAAKRTVVDSGEGKIVSTRTVLFESDMFAGTCAFVSFWYDRAGCSLSLSTLPKTPAQGQARDACDRAAEASNQ